MKRNRSSLSFRNRLGIGLVAMTIIGVGCAVDDPHVNGNIAVDLDLQGGGGGGDPGIPNHLQPRCLMDHGVQKSVRELGSGALVDSNGYLPSMSYMPAASATGDLEDCRRDFLGILIECALDANQGVADPNDIISVNNSMGPIVYPGAIGLAPGWETGALTTDEEELVTACVLARVNRYGTTVMVGLQGPNFPSDPEVVDEWYDFRESTVWGNMFASEVELDPESNTAYPLPFTAHVCEDYDIGRCPDEWLRVCDESAVRSISGVSDCGFITHASCFQTMLACAGSSPPAYCEGFDNKVSASIAGDGAVCPYNIGIPEPRPYPELPLP